MVSGSKVVTVSEREQHYKLDELASLAEVSVRTVRYYVQRGLLTAPTFRGRDTVYGPEHLLRLKVIKRMQAARLPLDEILAELGRRTEAELVAMAEGKAEVPAGAAIEAEPDSGAASVWTRWRVAPGLEIHLADDAEPEVKALAERLRDAAGAPTQSPHEHKKNQKKGSSAK